METRTATDAPPRDRAPQPDERFALRALGRCVRPGDTVLDVGANAGAYTFFLAELVGPAGRVLAFEPVPWLAASLRAAAADRPGVEVIEAAVADDDRAGVPFHLDEHEQDGRRAGVYSSLYDIDDPAGRRLRPTVVRQLALDTLWAERGLAPAAVKIDVEGAEPRVIAGAPRMIAAHRPVLLFEMWQWSWALGFRDAFLFLEELGYRLMRLDDRMPVDHRHYDAAPPAGTAYILARAAPRA